MREPSWKKAAGMQQPPVWEGLLPREVQSENTPFTNVVKAKITAILRKAMKTLKSYPEEG